MIMIILRSRVVKNSVHCPILMKLIGLCSCFFLLFYSIHVYAILSRSRRGRQESKYLQYLHKGQALICFQPILAVPILYIFIYVCPTSSLTCSPITQLNLL